MDQWATEPSRGPGTSNCALRRFPFNALHCFLVDVVSLLFFSLHFRRSPFALSPSLLLLSGLRKASHSSELFALICLCVCALEQTERAKATRTRRMRMFPEFELIQEHVTVANANS